MVVYEAKKWHSFNMSTLMHHKIESILQCRLDSRENNTSFLLGYAVELSDLADRKYFQIQSFLGLCPETVVS